MELKKSNRWYFISGVIGAALITWGTITTINLNQNQKNNEKIKQEYLENDQKRVDSYNLLVGKYNNLLKQSSAKDTTIMKLNKENNRIKNDAYKANEAYTSQNIILEDKLRVIDSITLVLEDNIQKKKQLEELIQVNNSKIESLESERGIIKEKFENNIILSDAKTDTIDLMQKYLNAYMIHRRPIKTKQLENIYLPKEWRLLPVSTDRIKEIRTINKDYKNKNSEYK
ncbi:MAG: hypothetical protein ACP5N1_05555 [Candidatus Woesearchaeota archaeon]